MGPENCGYTITPNSISESVTRLHNNCIQLKIHIKSESTAATATIQVQFNIQSHPYMAHSMIHTNTHGGKIKMVISK